MVRSIKFAKVLQIFYPYSIQTHPNTFPGDSPNDCPSWTTKKEVEELNCINKDWPDHYGHYRKAKVSQIKHHWWWKAYRVFDELKTTQNYSELFLFLEEDHYLSEDFLVVLSHMKNQRYINGSIYDILSLGTHATKLSRIKDNFMKVGFTYWNQGKHNMGMAFDRILWDKIKSCKQAFCNFDDYNWDFSLLHVSTACLEVKLRVMFLKGPRIFHMGKCGFHNKKDDECNTEEVVRKIVSKLEELQPLLYPKSLSFEDFKSTKIRDPKGFGGWGDKRDQELCMKMDLLQNNTITDTLMSLMKIK